MNLANSYVLKAYLKHKEENGTQASFSELIGRTQPQVSRYLNGKSTPSTDVVMMCMEMLDKYTGCDDVRVLLDKVKMLGGKEHSEIRATISVIIDSYQKVVT